jgi:hypothetical protein
MGLRRLSNEFLLEKPITKIQVPPESRERQIQ